MTAKSSQMVNGQVQKMPGWFSWRHHDNTEHVAARERYLGTHGRRARRESAKARSEAYEALTVDQRAQQRAANLNKYARKAVVVDDYIDEAEREGFIGVEATRRFFAEKGVEL